MDLDENCYKSSTDESNEEGGFFLDPPLPDFHTVFVEPILDPLVNLFE
jgi:hypothetical protein